MDRRKFLKTVTFSSAAALTFGFSDFAEAVKKSKQRPNVILILTDDQGYGDLGCHGNPYVETPNLDKLHGESVRFTNFHVDPLCAPTRAALMTGRYSHRVGVWATILGRNLLRRDETTMAGVFADNGYRTGIFGKWHLGDNYPFLPQYRGFQETIIHGGGAISHGSDYWQNDYFDDTYYCNGVPRKFEGYCTDVFFDETIRFMEKNVGDLQPFFIYLPTNAPHIPYYVPDKYREMYEKKGLSEDFVRFYGMITNIDENVGKLLTRIGELGIENNTIVIFMTDNGNGLIVKDEKGKYYWPDQYNAGMRGSKCSEPIYEGGHRVPCFIRWPEKLKGGRDIQTLTAHIDILPTLIGMCGLKEKKKIKFDGMNLFPLLKETDHENWPDREIFIQYHQDDLPRKWDFAAVMTQRWRLINGQELYDMEIDPA